MVFWLHTSSLRAVTPRHCHKCYESLRYEEHLCKDGAPESRGCVKWLCHKCAEKMGFPCPFDEPKAAHPPRQSLYSDQLKYYRGVTDTLELMLEAGQLGPYLTLRLDANRAVIKELEKRLRK